jgi:hypothetical protein
MAGWTSITLTHCVKEIVKVFPDGPEGVAVEVDATGANAGDGAVEVDGQGAGYPNPTPVAAGSMGVVPLPETEAVSLHFRKDPGGPNSITIKYKLA